MDPRHGTFLLLAASALALLTVPAVAGEEVTVSAELEADPEHATPNEAITFDATGSWATLGIDRYQLNLTSDGSYDKNNTDGVFEHAYQTAGTYEVTVRVHDGNGGSDTATVEVVVEPNEAPSAAYTWQPQPVVEDQEFTLDASESSDMDGNLAGYGWDVDADGTVDHWRDPSEPTWTVQAGEPGDYPVRLVVQDTHGETDEVTRTVTVEANEAPTAKLEARPSPAALGETVTLDASASSDPDGEITTYAWDLDGDGAADRETSAPTTTTSFKESGDRKVAVAVTDDDGGTASAMVSVLVTNNYAPTAVLRVEPSEAALEEPVTFDASRSYDPDGEIGEVAFDFDGDGTYDATATQSAVAEITYKSTGEYNATVRVTDDEGAQAIAHVVVSVDENDAPTLAPDHTPDRPAPSQTVTLRAGADDPDDDSYTVAWRLDGQRIGQGDTTEHTFETTGDHAVEVQATDEHGANTTTMLTVTVAEDSGPGPQGGGSPSSGPGSLSTDGTGGSGSPLVGDGAGAGDLSGSGEDVLGGASGAGSNGSLDDGEGSPVMVTPDPPIVGEPVNLSIALANATSRTVTWWIDGTGYRNGSAMTYTFEEPGEHLVRVEVTGAKAARTVEEITLDVQNGSVEGESNASGQQQSVPGLGSLLAGATVAVSALVARDR